MNVGFVGLGKLGLPVATAMAARGLNVYGHDPHVSNYPDDLSYEEGFERCKEVAQGRVKFTDLHEVVRSCSVVFVATQTPHLPKFEGVTPLPDERADFDYCFLRNAVRDIVTASTHHKTDTTVCVISTVLPGTMRREIEPLLSGRVRLRYSPSFIAMGTTIRDFLDPEFVLIGGDTDGTIRAVYEECGIDRFYETGIENAELIKVAYNTFIGLKLAFANTLMEVCHKTPGTDVDEVTGALKLAHRRLISPAYMDAGMGDGGGCHPRDNIALSWLARELDLSYDLFEATMLQRERQAEWLADMLVEHSDPTWGKTGGVKRPIGILGVAYKPGSHIVTGSPAALVEDLLARRHGVNAYCFDPHVAGHDDRLPEIPHVWLVGCKHPEFPDLKLPEGSVVIDPWRYMPDQEGVEVIRVGQHPSPHHRQTGHGRASRPLAA